MPHAIPLEDPWDRLRELRRRDSQHLFPDAVPAPRMHSGYTDYPDNVVREFAKNLPGREWMCSASSTASTGSKT